ncbi:GOS2-like protein [Zea mays]|uniref:Protein translation factor SUI1 homolog n=1 Tax=Zea mays TaxID=4577 RepID=A0A1D6N9K0_MAIZE|nr:GOS2-like protein [Zea mays]
MSDLDVQLPSAFDPFAEANAEDSSAGAGSKDYVHVRIQQRNGRKSLTTVQGLKKEYSYNKILKDLKKEFCCNGTVVQDPELGQVIQLQGDQRKNVATFLVQVLKLRKLVGLRNISSRYSSEYVSLFDLIRLVLMQVVLAVCFVSVTCMKVSFVWGTVYY